MRRRSVRITPLGYIVLSIIILLMLVGIYFIIWSMRSDAPSTQGTPAPTATVASITPTPSLAPIGTPEQQPAVSAPTTFAPADTPSAPQDTPKPIDTPQPSVKTPSPSQVKTAVDGKTTTKLNLRAGASMESSVLSTYSAGTRLKIYALEGDFYFVQALDDAAYGYMAAQYVEKEGLLPGEEAPADVPEGAVKGVVTVSKVALRTMPTTEGNSPIGEIPNGTEVLVYFQTGDFYYLEVVSTGVKCYGKASFFKVEGDVPKATPKP